MSGNQIIIKLPPNPNLIDDAVKLFAKESEYERSDYISLIHELQEKICRYKQDYFTKELLNRKIFKTDRYDRPEISDSLIQPICIYYIMDADLERIMEQTFSKLICDEKKGSVISTSLGIYKQDVVV